MKLHAEQIFSLGHELGGTLTATRDSLVNLEHSVKRVASEAGTPPADYWPKVSREVGEWHRETTAQRYYGNEAPISLGRQKIYWLDMELPTYGGRIDLLGAVKEHDKLRVFAELKYSTSEESPGGGSPISALLQALRYVADAAERESDMSRMKGHKGRPNSGSCLFPTAWFPSILVAGNEYYWSFWHAKLGENFMKLETLGETVAELLAQAYPDRPAPWVRWAKFANLPPEGPLGSKEKYEVPEATGESLMWNNPFDDVGAS